MGFRFSTYACNAIARSLLRIRKQASRHHERFPVQHDVSLEQPDEPEDQHTELAVERLNRVLRRNLGELTELESQVIAQRFPPGPEPRLTYREIGEAVGLSKERVRQIQNVALDKLREVLSQDPMLQ
jgi:RNA polymerase sigma factor (sigma-70 family)